MSISYNQAMGYRLLPGQDDVINQVYELIPDVYFKATAKLHEYAKTENKIHITLSREEMTEFAFLVKRFVTNSGRYGITFVAETV